VLPVVREALAKLAPHVERQGFELSLEADEALPDVDLDRDALTQVVFNLVDNAVKYARSASDKRIVVGCRVRPGDKGSMEIVVRDHGPGVPNEELGRIFEPFFRREDELTRTTKGTGIGLALVKELVESLGGRVTAENVEDGGFRVRVSLPAA
jgi:signal transduction histidine kinase